MAATCGVPVKSTSAVLALGTMLLLLSGSHALSQPRFTKVPVDQIGVSGGVVSLVCQATGDPKPRVNWTKNGDVVSSQRIEIIEFDDGAGSVLRIQPLRAPRDESNYECVAESSEGQVTATARVSVIREENLLPAGFPSIDMGPQLKVVERTRTATMLCAASGDPNPDITWFKDFLPIDIEASNGRIKLLCSQGLKFSVRGALQIENSEESDMGKYECVASNVRGVRYSSPAHLYVRDPREVRRVPPRFSVPPTSQEVAAGGSVNLTCVAVGSPVPYVKWTVNGEDLTLEKEMPNVLELTDIRQSANYTCVAMSSLGMIEAVAEVTVKRTLSEEPTDATPLPHLSTPPPPTTTGAPVVPGNRCGPDDSKLSGPSQDEDELYLQSLLPVLRRLDQRQKARARLEILKVLTNIEFHDTVEYNIQDMATPSPT